MAKVIVIYGDREQYAVQFELLEDGGLAANYGEVEFTPERLLGPTYAVQAATVEGGVQPVASVAKVIRDYTAEAAQ